MDYYKLELIDLDEIRKEMNVYLRKHINDIDQRVAIGYSNIIFSLNQKIEEIKIYVKTR